MVSFDSMADSSVSYESKEGSESESTMGPGSALSVGSVLACSITEEYF